MNSNRFRYYLGASALAVAIAAVMQPQAAQAATDGAALLQKNCLGCHTPEGDNGLSRISHQRKTPEGWVMTIARMQIMHGVKIGDDERRALVKYLADTQGLAPSETDGVRYAMERRLNTVEQFDPLVAQMCGRCHSGARVALQRRPAEEWNHLVDFHVGQYSTLEYQTKARDRDWVGIARSKIVPALAEKYALDNPAWGDWQKQRPQAASLAGQWSFSGHMPSRGDVRGVMTVKPAKGELFDVQLKGQYADGSPFEGSGSAVLYSGYEWRANLKVGEVAMRQVFSALDGEMKGRMFETENDERGLDVVAAKEGQSKLLAVQPGYLKAGSEAELTLVGSDLSGTPELGAGVEVLEVLEQSPQKVRVKVKAAADAVAGLHDVSVGAAKGASLALYKDIAEVKVVPEFSVARVGGNGGSTPKVQGRFDAEAWGKGADGQPYRIGVFPAKWSVEPFNERAKEDEDVKFAGVMDAASGVFLPGDAGPNPQRKQSTNNAGNLKVIAAVDDGGKSLKGEGQMIVTVQRWNNPPIP